MAFLKALAIAVVVGGSALVAWQWDDIFFVQGFEGRVSHAYQDTAGFTDGRQNVMYMVKVETAKGTELYEVPMRYFSQLKPGVAIKKPRFSTRLVITP